MYDDIINELHSSAEVEAFKYGFRLALDLMNGRNRNASRAVYDGHRRKQK